MFLLVLVSSVPDWCRFETDPDPLIHTAVLGIHIRILLSSSVLLASRTDPDPLVRSTDSDPDPDLDPSLFS